jgi:hypothetical protein
MPNPDLLLYTVHYTCWTVFGITLLVLRFKYGRDKKSANRQRRFRATLDQGHELATAIATTADGPAASCLTSTDFDRSSLFRASGGQLRVMMRRARNT